jgi:hypothetical protein
LPAVVLAYPGTNDRYEGTARKSLGVGGWGISLKPHGKGVCTYKRDGGDEVYRGDWVNGVREGRGIYTYPDGDRYDGEWVNIEECREKMRRLKLDVRNGNLLLEKLKRKKREIEEILRSPLIRTIEVIRVDDENQGFSNGLVDVNRDILMKLIKIIHDDDKTRKVVEFCV